MQDSQAHSPAMGQEDCEKWTAAAHLQPAISKSDRLLGPYNTSTMRRWLIAIFSLLFILSVSPFALDQIQAGSSTSPLVKFDHGQSSIVESFDHSNHEAGLPRQEHDQGLADYQIELPEQMLFTANSLATEHSAPSPAARPLRADMNPTLDGLRRPPRA